MPAAPAEAMHEIEGTLAQLRAEVAGTTDKSRQARLLGEVGELLESAGDETSAAKEYLAAYNSDPGFREPLEGLVRLLERRRSLKNLGKIVDALLRSAHLPEEKARALLAKAAHLEDASQDLAAAKGAALEAAEIPPPEPEAAQAWLMLEMLAAKLGDAPLREQAIHERAKHAGDPTWRALLQIDLAKLRAAAGDVEAALTALEAARQADTLATYGALGAIERLVRAEPGLPGSDEAQSRARILGETLEAQAKLLHEAIKDPARGDALGVPHWVRAPVYLVGAWLRAADTRRVAGHLGEAAALLDDALRLVADTGPDAATLEPALMNARIRIAELVGDTGLAAELAKKRLANEKDGGVAAALAMRVAEHAASEGDADAALEALLEAIRHDPACIPARALQLDLLADGADATIFAGQLEAFAEHLTVDDARGRAYLLAAYVWGVRAKDAAGAKAALAQAAAAQVPAVILARVARAIASSADDRVWFEETTQRLVAASAPDAPGDAKAKADDEEIAQAWFQAVRSALARGDAAGTTAALQKLGASADGEWLARALEGFLPESAAGVDPARRRAAIDEMGALATDPDLSRGMGLVAAMRAHRAGDRERAREKLRELAEAHGGDELIATYLADLERAGGDGKRAADAAAACAVQTPDPELAAALLIEAGFERWRHGDRPGALAALEEAVNRSPAAAKVVLGWAARGSGDGSVEARRIALERAADAGADPRVIALERFATEAAGGDPDDALAALSELEKRTAGGASHDEELALAAALARVAWPPAVADPAAIEAALKDLERSGPDAKRLAAAERVRLAREGDPEGIAAAAKAWFDVGGGVPAALEWLAGAMATGEADREVAARVALAETLRGAAGTQLHAGVAVTRFVRDGGDIPFARGTTPAVRLTNLELSPPGCDPRRRTAALVELDGALGDEPRWDALGLAGWSMLATGDAEGALDTFTKVTAHRPGDLAAWEGLRSAADACEQKETRAVAAEKLGDLCTEDTRGAEHWEHAATDWLELGDGARGEAALDRAFARDPKRAKAFDTLFRRVRERKDGTKLIEITTRRLEVADDPTEMTKLFWEQARVLRERGDNDAAMKALEHVTMLEPDHVGALALTGEIAIRRGLFEEAATALARLATLEAAPPRNRVTAGVAAVDLYENKLDRHDKALEVLLVLHRAKLTTLPVRERLARAAGRTGAWREATSILEELMMERPEATGRVEAARLAMAIYRDRLGDANAARNAIAKLLEEVPGDGEGVDMLLSIDLEATAKRRLLDRARYAVIEQVQQRPTDLALVRRLSNMSRALGDDALWQAALSVSIALGEQEPHAGTSLMQLSSRKPRMPQMALNDAILRGVLAPGDDGPVAQLFSILAPTLAEALGPSLAAAGVTKKDKVDPRSGLAVRNEIASWAGAFGFREFDLYVGGKDPLSVVGVPGEVPALVIGAQVNAPLLPGTRGRIARELLALLRGSTITRWRDDTTIAAIVVAACNLAEVRVEAPPYAMLAEVEKLISKAISRKTKKAIADVCRAVVATRADARGWAHRALASHNRIAAVASGDATAVILDLTGQPLERLPALVPGDSRVEELIRFVLSAPYVELRRSLGLEGAVAP
jgi:cellulose synthase operon protein C